MVGTKYWLQDSSKIKYNLSKDYETLYDICINNKARVVCFVNYRKSRDICSNLKSSNGIIDLSSRGISYLYAISKDEFIELCKELNLEYIPIKE